ncbi:MAG: pyridoxal phosphate-dependent aminotransferase [Bacilli bacterium]
MYESKFLSKRCNGVSLKGDVDILTIGALAKEAKSNNQNVINATVGTLYDEYGHLYHMKTVDKIIKSLEDNDFYSYAPINGGAKFQKSIINWVLGNYKEEVLNNLQASVCATPGGTGAVNNSIFSSLDEGETLLLPDLFWGPYSKMAFINKVNVEKYTFIVDGKFNLQGFKEKSLEIIKHQGKLVTILNDPCNNPTGYALSLEEFKELIDFINQIDAQCIIIYDIAYLDYYIYGMDEARKKFQLISKINDNVVFDVCFSASKTFSVYGMRLGALMVLAHNQVDVDNSLETSMCLARTRWSSTNKAGEMLLVKIDEDTALKAAVIDDINVAATLVRNRIELFNKEAEAIGLEIFPVRGGFFACLKTNDGLKLYDKLIEAGIYVIPYKKAIRIALCSLSMMEIKGLARKIKNCL